VKDLRVRTDITEKKKLSAVSYCLENQQKTPMPIQSATFPAKRNAFRKERAYHESALSLTA